MADHDDTHANDHEAAPTLGQMILAIQSDILHATRQRDDDFTTFVNVGTTPQEVFAAGARGVIEWIHNPTGAQTTITLTLDSNPGSPACVNFTLGAQNALKCYMPFRNGLIATSGTGIVLGGRLR